MPDKKPPSGYEQYIEEVREMRGEDLAKEVSRVNRVKHGSMTAQGVNAETTKRLSDLDELKRQYGLTTRREIAEDRYRTIADAAKPMLDAGLTRTTIYERLKRSHGWTPATSRRAIEHIWGKARKKKN